jgi:hypothetical protein
MANRWSSPLRFDRFTADIALPAVRRRPERTTLGPGSVRDIGEVVGDLLQLGGQLLLKRCLALLPLAVLVQG